MDAFYFGCENGRAGHYLFNSRTGRKSQEMPAGFGHTRERNLDGGFCPKGTQVEGVAKLTHENGYTVIAFWDRSVDRRPGSNSNFLLPGDLTFNEALIAAMCAFPEIFKRYPFAVTPEA